MDRGDGEEEEEEQEEEEQEEMGVRGFSGGIYGMRGQMPSWTFPSEESVKSCTGTQEMPIYRSSKVLFDCSSTARLPRSEDGCILVVNVPLKGHISPDPPVATARNRSHRCSEQTPRLPDSQTMPPRPCLGVDYSSSVTAEH
jgi:hypothetical protein